MIASNWPGTHIDQCVCSSAAWYCLTHAHSCVRPAAGYCLTCLILSTHSHTCLILSTHTRVWYSSLRHVSDTLHSDTCLILSTQTRVWYPSLRHVSDTPWQIILQMLLHINTIICRSLIENDCPYLHTWYLPLHNNLTWQNSADKYLQRTVHLNQQISDFFQNCTSMHIYFIPLM